MGANVLAREPWTRRVFVLFLGFNLAQSVVAVRASLSPHYWNTALLFAVSLAASAVLYGLVLGLALLRSRLAGPLGLVAIGVVLIGSVDRMESGVYQILNFETSAPALLSTWAPAAVNLPLALFLVWRLSRSPEKRPVA